MAFSCASGAHSRQPTPGAGLVEKNWARFGNYFQPRCPLCDVGLVTLPASIGTFQGAILATLRSAGQAETRLIALRAGHVGHVPTTRPGAKRHVP